jgi:aminopeptidase N
VLDGNATVELPGCGAVVVNGGQLGYFRTLYSPAMAASLTEALPRLAPIDQLGLLRDAFGLAQAGYQPMGSALDMLAAVPGDANPIVAQGALARWDNVYDYAGEADRAAVAALAHDRWLPRLQQLRFRCQPRRIAGRHPAARQPAAHSRQARRRDRRRRSKPAVRCPGDRSEVARRTAQDHLARDRRAQRHGGRMGSPRRARRHRAERGRAAGLLTLLGAAKDPALAQKALDFALTGKAGTTSAAIIAAVSAANADLAFDFAIANRAGRGAGRCLGPPALHRRARRDSRDPAMIGKLERSARRSRPTNGARSSGASPESASASPPSRGSPARSANGWPRGAASRVQSGGSIGSDRVARSAASASASRHVRGSAALFSSMGPLRRRARRLPFTTWKQDCPELRARGAGG